jgi:hypothetical protein
MSEERQLMARHCADDADNLLVALGMFHGIYKRVAAKVGVGSTTVSRVARGQRNSSEVAAAIREELRLIRDYLNRTTYKSNGA